ncbi:hypothetical protein K4A83_21110 [Spirulina subsalsa FACHB-351]|uniref:SHOCT domain-containing protein n=1 Tax=Spirulina subsalsa FACHB-351 TaxID=234711 RepID=A0ABT3LB55_9CYAN|nr:hypothetical protein [Spirulina subsalsa]MCW6038749.1 hypothetical protein [Spirulina subsalsa FACHB-351]
MKEGRPIWENLSEADQAQLQHLKQVIEKAVEDGVVTKGEYEEIKRVLWADKKASPAELGLINELIHQKIARGELEWGWS